MYHILWHPETQRSTFLMLYLFFMNTVQEPGTTSRKQHHVSSQLLMCHQQWHRAPHLGTGCRKLCLKHTLPSGPCYNKASGQGFRGVQNQKRLNFTGDWANSPLSILLHRWLQKKQQQERKLNTEDMPFSEQWNTVKCGSRGRISHPLARNPAGASCTHEQNALM